MSDVRNNTANPVGGFKEAVCIDAGRVFDSCCDRDCFEDLRCYFTSEGQSVINSAINIRAKSAEVYQVYIDVEPVTFNRGYYSCSLNFYFLVEFEVVTSSALPPVTLRGFCSFEKKVILFGSEGNAKVFSSDKSKGKYGRTTNMPRCVVQTVDPIALSARICELKNCIDNCPPVPECICDALGGSANMCSDPGIPTVYVTLGLFSIVQLVRNVQMLIPIYDFCIPEKQCVDTADSPCDVFSKLKFPTDDFFPADRKACDCGCTTPLEK